MRSFMRSLTVLVALLMITGVSLYAQSATPVEKAMAEIVAKYENTKGVDCITATKGSGLEMMKMMLNKQLGKSFMKGVTSITIIEYSEASAQVCQSLRKDLDIFTSLLEELDAKEDGDSNEDGYSRCFASPSKSGEGKLSDFIIAIEDDETKTIMYMAGEITIQ